MEDDPIKDTVDHPEHVNPAPDHVDPPVNPEPDKPHDDTKALVSALEAKVDALAEQVASLVPGEQDSKPTKRPWTHMGNR